MPLPLRSQPNLQQSLPSRRAAAADGSVAEAVGAIARQPSRFDALTLQETYIELGAADAAVDAALARLTAIWTDAQALDFDLDHGATPRKRG